MASHRRHRGTSQSVYTFSTNHALTAARRVPGRGHFMKLLYTCFTTNRPTSTVLRHSQVRYSEGPQLVSLRFCLYHLQGHCHRGKPSMSHAPYRLQITKWPHKGGARNMLPNRPIGLKPAMRTQLLQTTAATTCLCSFTQTLPSLRGNIK